MILNELIRWRRYGSQSVMATVGVTAALGEFCALSVLLFSFIANLLFWPRAIIIIKNIYVARSR